MQPWLVLVLTLALSACAAEHPSAADRADPHCHTESGWVDSTNGCSERAGYPDCYLVCPDKGSRQKL